MLDNKDINEQFVNEGWAQMRQILDTEMPVTQEDRKRPLFWLWSRGIGIAALALMGSFGLWHMISEGSSEATIAASTESAQQATTAPETATATTAESAIAKANAREQTTTAVANSAQAETSMLTPNVSRTSKTTVAASGKQQSTAIATMQPSAFGNTTKSNTTAPLQSEIAASTATSDLPANASTTQESLETTAFQVSENSLLQPLMLMEQSAISQQIVAAEKLPVSPKIMPKPATWRTGLELGVIAGFPAQLEGFSAGWTVELPVNKSIALRSGLRYGFHRQTVSKNDRQANLDAIEISTLEDPFVPTETSFVGASIDSTAGSSTLKLHYASLPVAASFRLGNRLSIEGGVQVSYLFNAFRQVNRNSEGLSTDNSGAYLDSVRSSWYFSDKAQQLSQENFRRWDVALSAGLRYRLSRHWDASFYGNYGLLNQADEANGYRIFNKNATLGVGYYF